MMAHAWNPALGKWLPKTHDFKVILSDSGVEGQSELLETLSVKKGSCSKKREHKPVFRKEKAKVP